MVKVEVKYRYCKQIENVIKAGYPISGKQHGTSVIMNKYFQLEYSNNACKPGVKEQIVEMAINGRGVRSTKRAFKINIHPLIQTLNLGLKNLFKVFLLTTQKASIITCKPVFKYHSHFFHNLRHLSS